MDPLLQPMRRLYELTDADRPPEPPLYVPSKRSIAGDVAGRILVAPGQNTKHLLYGARGGGKSTQLREIGHGLVGPMTVVDIDLDRSGISVAGLAAIDLLYVIGVATLRFLEPGSRASGLHDTLATAYAGSERSALGRLDEALPGVAGFGDAVITAAAVLGMVTAPAAMVVAGVKAAMHTLRLRTRSPAVVSAASPQGREVQAAIEAIFGAVRDAHAGRPIAILVDGLEKINGEAAQWLRDTFENTRLLTDMTVTMVVASPPCPFRDTNSAGQVGWSPRVIYGFAPDDLSTLALALRRRIEAVQVPVEDVDATCAHVAEVAGGHPRHAMMILRDAALRALMASRLEIQRGDIDAAVRTLREDLAMGLGESGYDVLRRVHRTHRLPDSDAAGNVAMRLFSDGRILVHPPVEMAHTFHVHPLLVPWIDEAAVAGPAGHPPRAG